MFVNLVPRVLAQGVELERTLALEVSLFKIYLLSDWKKGRKLQQLKDIKKWVKHNKRASYSRLKVNIELALHYWKIF